VVESEEARDQDDYLENKKSRDKQLLDKMNAAIVKEFGGDESKFNFRLQLNIIQINFSWQRWTGKEKISS